jgi:signal transduction histidine kinase
VHVGHHGAGLTLRVANTAPPPGAGAPSSPPAPQAGGHGLLGMRERTAMLGGEFTCGPTPDGGYEVLATLPNALPNALPTAREDQEDRA